MGCFLAPREVPHGSPVLAPELLGAGQHGLLPAPRLLTRCAPGAPPLPTVPSHPLPCRNPLRLCLFVPRGTEFPKFTGFALLSWKLPVSPSAGRTQQGPRKSLWDSVSSEWWCPVLDTQISRERGDD